MALELFKPFIMKKLVDKDVVYNIKKAKMLVEQESPEVFAILDEVVREHPVMLNRAPTLHRLGIQAFEPVLVEGKAIKLHPLVCHAFNADFDGDQMAVHVPLTQAAQMECWTLMLSARNLLDPANGKTIVYPSQDMVLGIYYLTKVKPSGKGTGKRFSSVDEVMLAAENHSIDWQAMIKVPYKGELVETTPGRLVFNEEMPEGVEFVNYLLGDKELKKFIEKVYREKGPWLTVQMLDAIKSVGYRYAMFFGATISMDDILIPESKPEMMDKANKEVEAIQKQYHQGHITQDERYNRVVEVWSKANEELTNIMMKNLEQDQEGFNTIYMMATSGARGSRNQIRQLAGMRGLMAKPNGDIIELPIRSNFKEGLTVIEFFISTNGARKGLADTALKTADAGYLTRRLVDIAQDVVINEEDCGTINGIEYGAVKDGDEVVESLRERIAGRFTLERVLHPITRDVIIDVNEYIDDDRAAEIEKAGVESVKLRTVLTCESKHGVCCKCYGRNLAHNKIIEIGEAVGIIAAQSIGQPGTQLTMRTFHVGGTATKISEENRIVLKYPIIIREIMGNHVEMKDDRWLFTRKGAMIVSRIMREYVLDQGDTALVEDGHRVIKGEPLYTHKGKEVLSEDIAYVVVRDDKIYLVSQEQKIEIKNGSELQVKAGDIVPAEKTIAIFDPFSEPIIAEVDGYVHYEDIIAGSTLHEEVDEETGKIEKRVSEFQLETKQPRVIITDEAGNELGSYYLPGGAYLLVDENSPISAGMIIAKMLKESAKTKDITGGLPRVSELFEARKPKVPAVLAQITGTVQFKGILKGKRVLIVRDQYGKEFKHLVPMTKRLLVRDGDTVESGEQLCDGGLNPHDVLAIMGENALQNYLMDEIQQVYRMQGVSINDKHIGVIVRQMLRKVEVVAVGDTRFIFGQQVDKYKFHEENSRVMKEGGQPSIARPMFQGITKASLNIDSFISAASFQETTRVLTNAAIAGVNDGLRGLKENVIIGHPIPAGTGIRPYSNVKLFDANETDLDIQMDEILEQRKLEKAMEAEVDDTDYDSEED
jgi:DNA-directed RNA polymerase subunit beta'